MMKTRIELAENSVGGVNVWLTDAEAAALTQTKLVTAMPIAGGGWQVTPRTNMVGAMRSGERDLIVRPKAKFSSLLFMLAYARDQGFRPDEFDGLADDDLWPAVGETLARLAERALERGILRGYATKEDKLQVVRGRIRISDQISRHQGIPIPLEVRYVDYSMDIPENRILRAALRRMATVDRLPGSIERRLRHLGRQLGAASGIIPGAVLPAWRPTRLNERYVPALQLSEIILSSLGLSTVQGQQPMASFVVDMAAVFESFVSVALAEALRTISRGRTEEQRRTYFDDAHNIVVRPDVVHLVGGSERAVYDAKYKLGGETGLFPVADLYQMYAYCTIMGLAEGHLIYAGTKSDYSGITEVVIRNAGVTVRIHPLDVSAAPADLLAQIRDIAVDSLRRIPAAM